MVRLAFFTQADFGQLKKWISDEQLLVNWSGSLFSFPLTDEELNWYINDANNLQHSDVLIYKAVDEDTGKVVGHISLGSINRTNRSARISRVLIGDTCERGKGYCQGMLHEILKIGFEELKLHRISLGVYESNSAAIHCYKKAGFNVDGVLRDKKKFGDSYWSLVEMSILEDEWRKVLAMQQNKEPLKRAS